MGNLKIFRASAGSGKTHHLTLEYLKLALLNPLNYRHILAVTFTNKATEEMKNRIINELYILASGKQSRLENDLLASGKFIDSVALRESAKKVLKNILYDYSNFSISTIDSFFQKILKNFIRETGLQAGYQPETDINRVLDKAVDLLYQDIGTDKALTEWLIRFAGDNIDLGKNWNLRKEIKSFSYEIAKEDFYRFSIEIGQIMKDKTILTQISNRLAKDTSIFENTLSEMGKKAIEILEKHDLSVDDFPFKSGSFISYFIKISLKSDFEPGKRAIDAMDNPDKWITGKSTAAQSTKINAVYHDGLNQLLHDSITFFQTHSTAYYSAKTVRKYFNILGILANLVEKLADIRDEENILLLSDAGVLLKAIINNNDSPFIYEKTGNYFNHFLIDEFQDTSSIQWENFRPLLSNSLSEGKDNSIVGDIKQSIYRWRGGDWNLLLTGIYDDFDASLIETFNLAYNWRSKSNITGFNNSLFLIAPVLLMEFYLKICLEMDSGNDTKYIENLSQSIIKAYHNNYQLLPPTKEKNEGIVSIRFFDKKNDEDEHWKEQVNNELPILIDEILDKKYKQGDITILVRNAREGQELANVLLAEGRFNIISKDSVFLGNSSAVRLIIASMRYLLDPSDTISKLNIVKEFSCGTMGKNPVEILSQYLVFSEENKTSEFPASLPGSFTSRTERLASLTIYDLVEQLIVIFNLNLLENELIFIQAFQDAILNYTLKFKSSLAAFLEWWDNYGNSLAIQVPDNTDAIRIMTIHKAKGLDFRILLIPYCNWNTDHLPLHDNVIWSQAAPGLIDPLKMIPVKYARDLTKTYFSKVYYLEKLQAFMDNLNLLYVALTRPVEGMYIMAPVPENDKITSVNSLLYQSVTTFSIETIQLFDENSDHHYPDLSQFWDENENTFTCGELSLNPEQATTVETAGTFLPAEYISNASWPVLGIKKAGIKRFETSERISKLDYGSFMHEILSKITHRDQAAGEITRLYLEGALNMEERATLSNKLEEIMDIRPEWFSDEFEVKTESPLILEKGKVIIPDRVLIKNKQAIVIDFKFGESKASHISQIKNYMSVLSEMGYENIEGYLLYGNNKTVKSI